MRMLWILAGLFLMFAGVFFLFQPGATLLSLALLIGIAMLVSGVADIVIFATAHNAIPGAGWVLADGIITVLLSLFLLMNRIMTAGMLPFIFGVWLLFTGISRAVGSFDLKACGVKGWGWFLFAGVALTALGFLSFVKPVTAAVAISLIAGVALIVEGAVYLLKGLFSNRFLM